MTETEIARGVVEATLATDPKVGEIKSETQALTERADKIAIQTAADYTLAGEFLVSVRRILKLIDGTFDTSIAAANTAHKTMIAAKKAHAAPLQVIASKVNQRMCAWDAEQERVRLVEQMRLQNIARAEEEDRRLADAIQLDAEGKHEAAMELFEEPIPAPMVVMPRTVPKVAGVSRPKETWKYEVTDLGKIPREYMMIDTVKIGQVVRGMKSTTNIPGIRAYSTTSVAVSA